LHAREHVSPLAGRMIGPRRGMCGTRATTYRLHIEPMGLTASVAWGCAPGCASGVRARRAAWSGRRHI